MRQRKLALTALGVALYAGAADAGPTLIRDTRVTDLAATPVLGRGYSISTNTFQSACLKDVIITEPSYDFQYLFKEAEEKSSSSSTVTSSTTGSYSAWWISAEVSASGKNAQSRNKTSHSMIVTLNMDTYYGSVNESGTPLSDSAAALLEREDVPGFFAACGPYYVRGINRNAQLVSLFTYETTETTRDTSFEASITAKLKGFGGGNSVSNTTTGEFASKASSRSLTITTRGWGLGKQADAALISYDMDTFKQAVKDAFLSMQNPLTGRVTSVEIVPWVENTEFQVKLNMNTNDVVSGKPVPLYEKKDILTMNGEFLSEMERASRARLNTYYTAKMCRNTILAKWSADGKSLLPDIGKKTLKNQRLGPADPSPVTVEKLFAAVNDAATKALYDEYSKFTFSGAPSVRTCVAKLMADPNNGPPPAKAGAAGVDAAAAGLPSAPASGAGDDGVGRGIFLKRYIDHDDCTKLQASFVSPRQQFEDYCMPELTSEP